jgi:hypothetical protein
VCDRQRVVDQEVIFSFLLLVTLPFWLSPCTAMILYRKLEKIFPSKETASGRSPNFYFHVSVSDLYTVKKKVREFPVPSRDVTTKLSLGGNNDFITVPLTSACSTCQREKV